MDIKKDISLENLKKDYKTKENELGFIEGDIEALRRDIYILKNEVGILNESFSRLRSSEVLIVSLSEVNKIKQTLIKVTGSLREKESALAERLTKHRVLSSEILILKEMGGFSKKECLVLEGPWEKVKDLTLI